MIYVSPLNRLPIWNSQNCSMFPLAFVAGWLQGHWWGLISRKYIVWPTFLLMNVFIALKGSHFWFLFNFTAAGVVPYDGRKTSPRTSTIVQFIFYFGPLRSAIILWPTFLLMNVFIALKGSHFWFLFNFTAAGVVPYDGRKTSPRTSTIVQFIFYFGPLRSAIIFWEIRNKWLVYTNILDSFYLFGPHFDLCQSLNRLPIWNSQNCSMFPLAFVAGWLQGHWWGFISRNYIVWPTFLLMNVFIALKGSHFWFLF